MLVAAFTALVSAGVLAGGAAGLFLHLLLPERHLTKETRDVVHLATGMLSVLAALVLGLLIATAKDSLSSADRSVRDFSAILIQAEQGLRVYGPEAAPARDVLRRYTHAAFSQRWTQDDRDILDAASPTGTTLEQLRLAVLSLQPASDVQRWLREQVLTQSDRLLSLRWQMMEQQDLPFQPVFVVLLTCWLFFIFTGFGFMAPRNAAVCAAFGVCAVAVGGAMFLILEMETPFTGIIQVSRQPLAIALAHMER